MHMGKLQINLLLLMVCICSATMGFGFTCKEVERNALLKLKHSLNASNLLGSWVGGDCCNWEGVGCDNDTGNVTNLDLGSEIMRYDSKAREVNPAILELKNLRYLDLSYFNFSGSRFPVFLGSMMQLQHLNLSQTEFFEEVPHNLGNLTNLVVLDLNSAFSNSNSLEWVSKLGNLQYLDLSWIDLSQAFDSLNVLLHKLAPSLLVLKLFGCEMGNSHLVIKNLTISSSPLQHLDLGLNFLSGPFPNFIQNLSSIEFLDLSSNELNSSLPSWMASPKNLKHLELDGNSFSGPFPQFIQNSSYLTHIGLSSNQFSSSIPSWLATKRDLEYLDLSFNNFDRVDGGIMNIMGRLCSLTFLDLSDNPFQEEVSNSQSNFSRCTKYDMEYLFLRNTNNINIHLSIIESFPSLRSLDLSYNSLETLPLSWGALSSLTELYLSHNNLSLLSPTIGNLSALTYLGLSHNSLETIPSSLGRLSSLHSLDLSSNHLSVVHQVSLANLSSLKSLDISSNSIVLDVSPDWMPPFQLEYLDMLPCKLNGPFPKWLLSQEEISSLDLSDTGISGPLPSNIGNKMSSLGSLRLANNHINGSIPISLCESASLGFLDLQQNQLSGLIPDCWANSQIVDVELSSNRLSGPIPKSLTKVRTLQLLSLSNNSLQGDLSSALSNGVNLMVLDAGNNNLHGEIPPWNRANFPFLQILILRGNRFKGLIPPQLCSIHTLEIIDLANNNLGGKIPQCFGHLEGMGSIQNPSPIAPDITVIQATTTAPTYTEEWSAVEVIEGQEREYTTILHLLVNMDLSCNYLVGVIPAEFTGLSLLVGLNLSHNRLTGEIPEEIGMMKALESLDLSSNNLSGSIPQSVSSLTFLSKMNLSFNNLRGQIPTGSQLHALDDPSIYWPGNPGLCGDPLPKKCFGNDLEDDDDEEEDKYEKMWFYLVIMLGFASGFWGVIGVLVVQRRWRHAYFGLAEEIGDWLYVRVALGIARARGGT